MLPPDFPASAPPSPTANPAADVAAPPFTWPAAWRRPAFRARLGLVLGLLLGLASQLPRYFAWVQARPGHLLPDPLLARLPAHDVSRAIFAVIYAGIALGMTTLLPRPARLLRALWAYLLLHLLRCGTLWLLPLEPPSGLVLLRDPLVDALIYAAPAPITKDLFFSGHTATLLLLALAVPPGWRRQALLAGTVAVGALVLVQHAHYTYDVLAAPLFVWLAWQGSRRLSVSSE
ncbi:phosphatase PAP2-related protein [Hymenobacter actinosclerus]|uniref:PAP2 superfamily C-terminal n=1 Tax=Hymenobacter actinosclerus TaxID=82805 RepID=A0A1I0I4V3_9BACT|nr:phosphatase PAP2-related protein [Hymenobacter actinosclerus]SET90820.1 PAP2 superfamily C-terminal [Hymenobacter actinosclerus]